MTTPVSRPHDAPARGVHSRRAQARALLAALALVIWVIATSACVQTDPPGPLGSPGPTNNAPATGQTSNCTNRCFVGERICQDEATVLNCVRNAQGCLDYGGPATCPSNRTCQNGTCVEGETTCSSLCQLGDPPRCTVEGLVEVCADHNGDGCRTYGSAQPCPEGQYCASQTGQCTQVACQNRCAEGQTSCDRGRLATCRADAFGCLDFSAAKDCPAGQTCEGNACRASVSCQDECQAGTTVCTADGGLRSCADQNGDGCLELSTARNCPSGQSCQGAQCVALASCQDQCGRNDKVCVGNQLSECRDQDGDGCLEFAPPTSCTTPGHTCQRDGASVACRAAAATGAVVINEILYDPTGADRRGTSGNYSSPGFVELLGPPGLNIAGFRLELIDGNSGNAYATVTLPSDASLDGYGYAVLAMDTPDSFLAYAAPFYTNVFYVMRSYSSSDALQNGPDNLVLKDAAGNVMDALGYGEFLPNLFFRGEGSPAPGTTSGRSLGRAPGAADTGNNARDFASYYPTPGLPNSDLRIHEAYFEQPGPNDGTEMFVELVAPIQGWEEMSLSGYVLRAIAGSDGRDYIFSGTNNTPGIVLDRANLNGVQGQEGYVVICHASANSALRNRCSLTYNGVPLYAGPDNLVLEYRGKPVDALGYGTFVAGSVFKGEGNPMPFEAQQAGKALGRWPIDDPSYNGDENDNYFDFWPLAPTPGRDNPRP